MFCVYVNFWGITKLFVFILYKILKTQSPKYSKLHNQSTSKSKKSANT